MAMRAALAVTVLCIACPFALAWCESGPNPARKEVVFIDGSDTTQAMVFLNTAAEALLRSSANVSIGIVGSKGQPFTDGLVNSKSEATRAIEAGTHLPATEAGPFEEAWVMFSDNPDNSIEQLLVVIVDSAAPGNLASVPYAQESKRQGFTVIMVPIGGLSVAGMPSLPERQHLFPAASTAALSTAAFFNPFMTALMQDPGFQCVMYGHGHYITFDGGAYTFPGIGDYHVLTSSTQQMEVQARFAPCTTGTNPSNLEEATSTTHVCLRGLAVYAGVLDEKVELEFSSRSNTIEVYINDQLQPLPASGSLLNGQLMVKPNFPDGWTATLDYDNANSITASFSSVGSTVWMSANRGLYGRLRGLCGNMNGCLNDDYQPQTGDLLPNGTTITQMYTDFGQTWKVSSQQSLFRRIAGHFDNHGSSWSPSYTPEVPNGLVATAAEHCQRLPQPLLTACQFDIAVANTGSHFWPSQDVYTTGCFQVCGADGSSGTGLPPHAGITAAGCDCVYLRGPLYESVLNMLLNMAEFSTPTVTYSQGSVTQPTAKAANTFVQIPDLGGLYTFVRTFTDTNNEFYTDGTDHVKAIGDIVELNVKCTNSPSVNAGGNITVDWTPYQYPEVTLVGSSGSVTDFMVYHWFWDATLTAPDGAWSLTPRFTPPGPGVYKIYLFGTDGCAVVNSTAYVNVQCSACAPKALSLPLEDITYDLPSHTFQQRTLTSNSFDPDSRWLPKGGSSFGALTTNFAVLSRSEIPDLRQPGKPVILTKNGSASADTPYVFSRVESMPRVISTKTSSSSTNQPASLPHTVATNHALNINYPNGVVAGPAAILHTSQVNISKSWSMASVSTQTELMTTNATTPLCHVSLNAQFGAAATIDVTPAAGATPVDCYGFYTLEMEVQDDCHTNSTNPVVRVWRDPPVANIFCAMVNEPGSDLKDCGTLLFNQRGFSQVQLSSDPSFDPLHRDEHMTYNWTVKVPQGSSASIPNSAAATISFTPDAPGDYEFTLIVSTEAGSSQPATYALQADCQVPDLAVDFLLPQTLNVDTTQAPLHFTAVQVAASVKGQYPLRHNYHTPQYSFDLLVQPATQPVPALYTPLVTMDPQQAENGNSQFTGKVQGLYTVQVTFSDGCQAVSTSKSIQLQDEHIINAQAHCPSSAVTLTDNTVVTLKGTAAPTTKTSVLNFQWNITSSSGSLPLLTNSTGMTTNLTNLEAGTYTATFIAYDLGTYKTATCQFMVQCSMYIPKIMLEKNGNSVTPADAQVSTNYQLKATVPSTVHATYLWQLISAPNGVELDAFPTTPSTQSTTSYTAAVAGTYTFKVITTDRCNEGQSATLQVTFSCTAKYSGWSPTIAAPEDVYFTNNHWPLVPLSASGSTFGTGQDGANFTWGWVFVGAPENSVYAPQLKTLQYQHSHQSSVVVPGPGEYEQQRITTVMTSTNYTAVTYQVMPHYYTTMGAASFIPDLPGLYTVQVNMTAGCQTKVIHANINAHCGGSIDLSSVPTTATAYIEHGSNTVALDARSITVTPASSVLWYKWSWEYATALDNTVIINNSTSPLAYVSSTMPVEGIVSLFVTDGCNTATQRIQVRILHRDYLQAGTRKLVEITFDPTAAGGNGYTLSEQRFALMASTQADDCSEQDVIWELRNYTATNMIVPPAPSSGLSAGAIAGIVIGILAFVTCVAALVYLVIIRSRKDPKVFNTADSTSVGAGYAAMEDTDAPDVPARTNAAPGMTYGSSEPVAFAEGKVDAAGPWKPDDLSREHSEPGVQLSDRSLNVGSSGAGPHLLDTSDALSPTPHDPYTAED